MELSIFIGTVILIFVVVKAIDKIGFLDLRKSSIKIDAEVVEYRKEKGAIRNDYTMLNYPYVKILTEGPDLGKVRRIKYANNWNKPFRIGERIEVFWSAGELLYWDAMEKGLYRYLPAKWPWNK